MVSKVTSLGLFSTAAEAAAALVAVARTAQDGYGPKEPHIQQ